MGRPPWQGFRRRRPARLSSRVRVNKRGALNMKEKSDRGGIEVSVARPKSTRYPYRLCPQGAAHDRHAGKQDSHFAGRGSQTVPFQIMFDEIHDACETQQVGRQIGRNSERQMKIKDALDHAHGGFVWSKDENHIEVRNHQYEDKYSEYLRAHFTPPRRTQTRGRTRSGKQY